MKDISVALSGLDMSDDYASLVRISPLRQGHHERRKISFCTTDRVPVADNVRGCVALYKGKYKVTSLSHLEQLLVMTFAQLTFRESPRGIEACLRAQPYKPYRKDTP